MDYFDDYLSNLPVEPSKKLSEIISWVGEKYPEIEPMIKWNHPMFAYQGTFIISFAAYKAHIAVAPEVKTMNLYREKIELSSYEASNSSFKINYRQAINFDLLAEIIEYQKTDKMGWSKF